MQSKSSKQAAARAAKRMTSSATHGETTVIFNVGTALSCINFQSRDLVIFGGLFSSRQ